MWTVKAKVVPLQRVALSVALMSKLYEGVIYWWTTVWIETQKSRYDKCI